MSEKRSAYIRYRASDRLDQLVLQYVESMEKPDAQPDLDLLLEIMDLFVAESVETFVLNPSQELELRSSLIKLIHSLVNMVEKSSHMLVRKVAKKMSHEDHVNAAKYMKQIRLAQQQDGKDFGDISFPIEVDFARLGVNTRDKILAGEADNPVIINDGIQFLHAVVDVANYWVFEEPVKVLKLKGVMKSLAVTTVGAVKKTTHALIEKLVPKLSEQQKTAAAKYFSNLVGPGPFIQRYGELDQETASRMWLT